MKIPCIIIPMLLLWSCTKSEQQSALPKTISNVYAGNIPLQAEGKTGTAHLFAGGYMVKEIAVDVWTRKVLGNTTFHASIVKFNERQVIVYQQRAAAWSIDNLKVRVSTPDSLQEGSIRGRRYGNDSLVVFYLYGLGSSTAAEVHETWFPL